MKTSKFMLTLVIGLALLASQTRAVYAAPALQESTISGSVTALECGTDSAGNTIVLVTLEDMEGTSQTVRISVETAESLGLVTLDEDGLPDCSVEAFAAILEAAPEEGLVVEIPSGDVIPVDEGMLHPVGYALSLFFDEIVDYDAIMEAHESGTGFGVIAQALWMTMKLEGDADIFSEILDAKESGDYSNFVLEDGSSPKNWGQFKKAVLNGDKKSNLGSVMSNQQTDDDQEEKMNNGNGSGKEKNDNGKGKGKGRDKGKDK